MRIEVWSDIVCPWCYLGKRHLEQALDGFEHAETVGVSWRSFELDPSAPRHNHESGDLADRLASKFGVSRAEAQALNQRMEATARRDGLEYHLDSANPANSFDAHRLVHLARDWNAESAMQERLFRAYFTEGVVIDDIDELCRLASEVGLDGQVVGERLRSAEAADAVRAEEREASELGISGVPFFVIDRRYGVSGAQPAAVLREVVEKAWTADPTLAAGAQDGEGNGQAG